MIGIEIFRSKHPDQLKRSFGAWQEANPECEVKEVQMVMNGEQIGLLVQYKTFKALSDEELDLGPLPGWVTDDNH